MHDMLLKGMRSATALLLCTLLLVHIIRASASATHSLPLDTTLPTALARPLPCRGKALASATAALKGLHIRLRAPPHWPDSDPVSAAYPSCSSWSSSQHFRVSSSKHTISQSLLFGGPVLSVFFAQKPPLLQSKVEPKRVDQQSRTPDGSQVSALQLCQCSSQIRTHSYLYHTADTHL